MRMPSVMGMAAAAHPLGLALTIGLLATALTAVVAAAKPGLLRGSWRARAAA